MVFREWVPGFSSDIVLQRYKDDTLKSGAENFSATAIKQAFFGIKWRMAAGKNVLTGICDKF